MRGWLAILAGLFGFSGLLAETPKVSLLHVSYDPTREFLTAYNNLFAEHYLKTHGVLVSISQSHGGSSKQARSVIEGLRADIVSLALAYDVDMIAAHGRLSPRWQEELPDHSSPFTSTIVFLVRKGNPKQIRNWPDLIKPGVGVITPNPKTSGGARWNFLAAWAYVTLVEKKNEKEAEQYMFRLFKNVPVLDTGARGATTTFVQRGIGDVYLTWENEAFLALKEYPEAKLEIIYPSTSILAQPVVSVVEANVKRKGPEARKAAEAYVNYFYTPEAQRLMAQHGFRPSNPAILGEFKKEFPPIRLFKLTDIVPDWKSAQEKFFAEEGVFDKIYRP